MQVGRVRWRKSKCSLNNEKQEKRAKGHKREIIIFKKNVESRMSQCTQSNVVTGRGGSSAKLHLNLSCRNMLGLQLSCWRWSGAEVSRGGSQDFPHSVVACLADISCVATVSTARIKTPTQAIYKAWIKWNKSFRRGRLRPRAALLQKSLISDVLMGL